MKRLLTICLTLCSALVLFAQTEGALPEVKIGYVNVAAVTAQLPQTKLLQEKISKQELAYKDEYEIMQNEYNQKVKAYLENSKQMSEPIKLARQAEITEYEKRLVLYRQRYEKDLATLRATDETEIQKAVKEAIAKVAREAMVTIVFEQGTPLYMDTNCVDLTSAVQTLLSK